MAEPANAGHRRRLGWLLAAVFVLAMVMGAGPGVLLVNRPETFFGLPMVYAWGIFWYVVQIATAMITYFTIWKDKPDSDSTTAGDTQ